MRRTELLAAIKREGSKAEVQERKKKPKKPRKKIAASGQQPCTAGDLETRAGRTVTRPRRG
jgi:hypothetical protein